MPAVAGHGTAPCLTFRRDALPSLPEKRNRSRLLSCQRLGGRPYNWIMNNADIAHEILRQARDLAASGDNLYRVRAFRRAAAELFGLDRPVSAILAEAGPRGLTVLPGVGMSLAKTIAELAMAPAAMPVGQAG